MCCCVVWFADFACVGSLVCVIDFGFYFGVLVVLRLVVLLIWFSFWCLLDDVVFELVTVGCFVLID